VDEHFRPLANQTGVDTLLLGRFFIWAFVTFLYIKIAFDIEFYPMEFPTLAAAFMGVMAAVLTVLATKSYAAVPKLILAPAFMVFIAAYLTVSVAITFSFAKRHYLVLHTNFYYQPVAGILIAFIVLTSVPVVIHFLIYVCGQLSRGWVSTVILYAMRLLGVIRNIVFHKVTLLAISGIVLIFCIVAAGKIVSDYAEKKRCEMAEHQPCTKFGGFWQSPRQYESPPFHPAEQPQAAPASQKHLTPEEFRRALDVLDNLPDEGGELPAPSATLQANDPPFSLTVVPKGMKALDNRQPPERSPN
jgi:hypothetical protein